MNIGDTLIATRVFSCCGVDVAEGDIFVTTITRYLKKMVVKPIRISEFTPSTRTIEREKIPVIVEEFKQFLESQFDDREKDETVPVLQLE